MLLILQLHTLIPVKHHKFYFGHFPNGILFTFYPGSVYKQLLPHVLITDLTSDLHTLRY